MQADAKLSDIILPGVSLRLPLLTDPHDAAVRLFNGYTEGAPGLVLELFARTLVITSHAQAGALSGAQIRDVATRVIAALPFIRVVLWKQRTGTEDERRGQVLVGKPAELDKKVVENGVRYAIELTAHQDSGFYIDTRELRAWLKSELVGKTVLNTFAYTGSLGLAASAGGAADVVHIDKNRESLNVAKASYTLNGLPVQRRNFVVADFFSQSSQLRKQDRLFDCVVLDPPLFSATAAGRVDVAGQAERLLNKARPLVADGGTLVFVNNALFVSGQDFKTALERVGSDGFVTIEKLLPVPEDVVGLAKTDSPAFPADPAPFNHPTKIAVLRVRRKDGRKATPAEALPE